MENKKRQKKRQKKKEKEENNEIDNNKIPLKKSRDALDSIWTRRRPSHSLHDQQYAGART
jgi:hypothetical protein